jgi:hypothetical protein
MASLTVREVSPFFYFNSTQLDLIAEQELSPHQSCPARVAMSSRRIAAALDIYFTAAAGKRGTFLRHDIMLEFVLHIHSKFHLSLTYGV